MTVVTKVCPSCQNTLSCSETNCWCQDFPAVMPMDSTQSCLCKKCLASEVKKVIRDKMQALTPQTIKQIQSLGKPEKLIEGIDYHFNDQGFLVFSGWYLLRQGKCCNNGCTNCPYPKKIKK